MAQRDGAEVIEMPKQARAESISSPIVAEDSVRDLRRFRSSERLRKLYRVTRRQAVELVLVGLCEKILALEALLELRDGFGRRARKEWNGIERRKVA